MMQRSVVHCLSFMRRIAFFKDVYSVIFNDQQVFDPKKYNVQGWEEVKQYVMQKMQVCGCAGQV